MTKSHKGQWEVLLADLALILFVTSLGGLVSMPIGEAAAEQANSEPTEDALAIAPSQALYRSVEGGPDLADWLQSQPIDPRATLTIFVDYTSADAAAILQQAAGMIEQAQASNVPVRTVIKRADISDVYASLAFDDVAKN